MVNWIGTENPFGMECPPDWWMKGLYDFDHMLVLIPSQRKKEYLLTRRRTMTQVDAGAVLLDNKNPDTKFCILNGIIPIAPLKWKSGTNGVFSQLNLDSLLNALRARDTYVYTHAGATVDEDAAWKAVEAEEEAQKAKDHSLMKEISSGVANTPRYFIFSPVAAVRHRCLGRTSADCAACRRSCRASCSRQGLP